MIQKASWKRENVLTWCNIFHLNKCYYLSNFPLNRYKSQSHTAFTLWSARESRGYWWCLYSCCGQHFVVCTWRQRWTGNIPAAQRGRGCHELTCFIVSRFNFFWDDSAPLSSINQRIGPNGSNGFNPLAQPVNIRSLSPSDIWRVSLAKTSATAT